MYGRQAVLGDRNGYEGFINILSLLLVGEYEETSPEQDEVYACIDQATS